MYAATYLSPQNQSFSGYVLENGVRDNKVQQGFGETATQLKNIFKHAYSHYSVPVTRISTRDKFTILAATWQRETQFKSFTADIIADPSYQRIIGMGQTALPYIFEQLQHNPAHWFWALESITGVNPVQPAHEGRVPDMTADWLKWGKNNGFIR